MEDHSLCASAQDSGALHALLARIDLLLPAEHAVLTKALAWASYRFTPARHLDRLDLDATAHTLASGLAFIKSRLPEAVSLRVEPNRSPEAGAFTATTPPKPVLAQDQAGTIVEIHMADTPFLLATVKAELEEL
jgi:hypothetical protein